MGFFDSVGKAVKSVAKAVSPIASSVSSIISPIASIAGGIGTVMGGYNSIFGSQPKVDSGPSYYDQLRMQSKRGLIHNKESRLQEARHFGRLADMMGVSRYALLGNAPGTGQNLSPTVVPRTDDPRSNRIARAMSKMGQDAQRGLQTQLAVADLKSQIKLRESQAGLNNAQARSLLNNQMPKDAGITEENLPPDEYILQQQQKQRGMSFEDQPTITKMGFIAHYPSQEIMDLISESAIAAGLYYKGKISYNSAMNRAHKMRNNAKSQSDPLVRAYEAEKRKLSWQVGKTVIWNPNAYRWMIK